jgi:hypothetical protein
VGKDGPKRSRFVLKKQPSSWPSSLHCQEKTALCKAIASGWFTHNSVSCLPISMACMSCTILSSTDYISILKQEATYSSVTLALTYQIVNQNITLNNHCNEKYKSHLVSSCQPLFLCTFNLRPGYNISY